MQRYVSDELTHFAGRGLREEEQYALLVDTILKSGRLGRGEKYYANLAYGVRMDKSLSSNEMLDCAMVCFCDIPVADFEIHMQKYSRFGLAFLKSLLIAKGVRPVFYVPKEDSVIKGFKDVQELYANLNQIVLGALALGEQCPESLKLFTGKLHVGNLEFAKSIIGYLKFFDIGTTDTDPTNYYMEREWRVLGQVQFALSDVWRIIVPSEYANRLRADLPEYTGQVTFSPKKCT